MDFTGKIRSVNPDCDRNPFSANSVLISHYPAVAVCAGAYSNPTQRSGKNSAGLRPVAGSCNLSHDLATQSTRRATFKNKVFFHEDYLLKIYLLLNEFLVHSLVI